MGYLMPLSLGCGFAGSVDNIRRGSSSGASCERCSFCSYAGSRRRYASSGSAEAR